IIALRIETRSEDSGRMRSNFQRFGSSPSNRQHRKVRQETQWKGCARLRIAKTRFRLPVIVLECTPQLSRGRSSSDLINLRQWPWAMGCCVSCFKLSDLWSSSSQEGSIATQASTVTLGLN